MRLWPIAHLQPDYVPDAYLQQVMTSSQLAKIDQGGGLPIERWLVEDLSRREDGDRLTAPLGLFLDFGAVSHTRSDSTSAVMTPARHSLFTAARLMSSMVAAASGLDRRSRPDPHVPRGRSPSLIDVPSMADGDDEDDKDLVVYLVDDAVVTGADPPFALTADQLLGSSRSRLAGQQLDGGLGLDAWLAGRACAVGGPLRGQGRSGRSCRIDSLIERKIGSGLRNKPPWVMTDN